jgi:PAS domain S-box-containing protein
MRGAKEEPRTKAQMLAEIERLRARLDEAEQTLEAIRSGDIDALVVSGPQGDRVFSLTGAERIYRVIVETMNEAAVMVDPDGTILFCNQRLCAWIGIPMEKAVGQNVSILVAPPQDAPLSRLLAVARTGSAQCRLTLRAANGDAVSAQLAASPLVGEDGPGVCLVISDLTELETSASSIRVLREHQQALEASEARYRALVEMAPDAIVVHQNERFVYANPAARQLFDAASTDLLLGRHILDVAHPDEHPAIRDQVQTVISEKTTPLWATRLLRLDGQEVPAEMTATLTEWQGQPAVQAIIRDITARKRAEAALETARAEAVNEKHRLEAVLEALPVGLSLVDARGGIIVANAAFEQLWGRPRPPARTVADYAAYRAWWPNTGRPVQPEEWASAQAMQDKRPVVGQLMQIERFNGTRAFVLNSAAPILDAAGEIIGAAVAIQDITELRTAQEALRSLNADLEQRVAERTAELSHTVDQLNIQTAQLRTLASEVTLAEQRERLRLAEVLHDGLQPLMAAAKIEVEILGRRGDSPVRQSCQEIIRLLDEALAGARSLSAELSPPVLRAKGLVAGLGWLAHWCQERHHLTVHVQAPAAPLPPLGEDLAIVLFQSVRELLFNVSKYAQVPDATVTLAWDGPRLTITVTDAGIGFDPRGLRGEGAGFGLAHLRQRLDLLGGRMTIASAPGQGTRVTLAVVLPTADQPTARPPGPEPRIAAEPLPTPAPESRRTIRILLVDDHEAMRQALARLLHAEPDVAVVGEASTGTAAVAMAREVSPDVVLMDINLPDLNGIEATRAIHAAFPAMRVIGLSMFDGADQQAAMEDAGAVGYVNKSAPAEVVLAAIRGCRTGEQLA